MTLCATIWWRRGEYDLDLAGVCMVSDGVRSLRANVYHALTINSEYAPFSNTRFPTGSDSIEKPHNSVHSSFSRVRSSRFTCVLGCEINIVPDAISLIMQEATVTAFDPIFW